MLGRINDTRFSFRRAGIVCQVIDIELKQSIDDGVELDISRTISHGIF